MTRLRRPGVYCETRPANQDDMKLARQNSTSALTLLEVLIVMVVVAIFLVSEMTVPLGYYSGRVPGVACMNNLKQVALSFQLWADDHNDSFPMQVSITNDGAMEPAAQGNPVPVFQVMSNELNTPKILICPADARGWCATNFNEGFDRTNIGYFVNLDATTPNPAALLCGDRNLTSNWLERHGILELSAKQNYGWDKTLHRRGTMLRSSRIKLVEYGVGNIARVNGDVKTLTSSGLNRALRNCGVATNRLVIP
jgi:competence protein ComGC